MKDKRRATTGQHHHNLQHHQQQHQSHRSLAASLSCFNKAVSESTSNSDDEDVRFTGMQDEEAVTEIPTDAARVGCMSLRRDKDRLQRQRQSAACAAAAAASSEPCRLADGSWCYALGPEDLLPPSSATVDRTQRCRQGEAATLAGPALCADPDPGGRTEQGTYTLERSGTSGYGFTLVGSQPVRVGKVDPDSPAGRVGIRSGDIVVSVNGSSVLSCSCDRVVHIIRLCAYQLEIGIQRWLEDPSPSGADSTVAAPPADLTMSSPPPPLPLPMIAAPSPPTPAMTSLSRSLLLLASSQQPLPPPSQLQPQLQPQPAPPPTSEEFGTFSIRRRALHRPERSALSQVAAGGCRTPLEVRGFGGSPPASCLATMGRARSAVLDDLTPPMRQHQHLLLLQQHQQQQQQHQHLQLLQQQNQPQRVLSPQPHMFRRQSNQQQQQQQLQHLQLHQMLLAPPQEVTDCELARQRAIGQLVLREEAFVRTLTACRQFYWRPLAGLLSQQELRGLFFNQESLLDASCSALQQIRRSETAPTMSPSPSSIGGGSGGGGGGLRGHVDNIGQIYRSRLFQTCDDYREYAENLAESGLALLAALQATREFAEALRAAPTDTAAAAEAAGSPPPPPPPLRTCLLRPITHLSGLARDFQAILSCTPGAHYDYLFVEDVQQNLEHCATSMPPMPPEMPPVQPQAQQAQLQAQSNHQHQQSHQHQHRHPTTSPTAHSLVASSSGVSSEQSAAELHHHQQQQQLDSDLAALQACLAFPGHVRPFHLLAPGRQLALAGELVWHCRDPSVPLAAAASGAAAASAAAAAASAEAPPLRVHAILLTDLLLMTQRRPGGEVGGLTALTEPFQLAACCQAVFDYAHNRRLFRLAFGCDRLLVLEAPSFEAKHMWRACIAQLLGWP